MELIDMKRKRNKIVECPICKGKNNLTEMEENNDIQLENSNNESNSTAVTKPKSWFTVIYKKIPGLLSWGFTSK